MTPSSPLPAAPLSRRDFLAAAAITAGLRPWRTQSTSYALCLGNVQDGGLPQPGCYTDRCNRARVDPRYVASLALVEPDAERFFLVDATPDITRQIDLIDEPAFRVRAQARRPFDGIFLTHAHIGHYLGLALLGRESVGIPPTPVYCTPTFAEYLTTNGPWSLMVEEGRLYFPEIPMNAWFEVSDTLAARMIPVPHRPEFSDTVAWVFRGPNQRLLYVPDIDRWERWDVRVQDIVREVDVALIDGSFYSPTEVPGRNIEDIPHPLIPHSMDLLQSAVESGNRVVFTHLNNSNAVLDLDSSERAEVLRRGFEVAEGGLRFGL